MSNRYPEFEKSVLEKLACDGQKKLQRRRKIIEQIAKRLTAFKWKDPTWSLRRRAGVWLSVQQGQALAANDRGITLSVQMLGRQIGKLRIRPEETRFVFLRTCRSAEVPSGYKVGDKWAWSRNRVDGRKIRAYIDSLRKILAKNATQEREVQWQLAYRLLKAKHKALVGLRPVLLLGFPTEFGVAMNQKGNAATGNVDLLVRGRGGRNGARFFVLELKRPEARTDAEAAMEQALRYAITLYCEANNFRLDKRGNGYEDGKYRKIYRKAFGSRGNQPLKFGAAIVLEDTRDNEKKASAALDELTPYADALTPNARPIIDRVGVLLYKWNGKTVSDFRWFQRDIRSRK